MAAKMLGRVITIVALLAISTFRPCMTPASTPDVPGVMYLGSVLPGTVISRCMRIQNSTGVVILVKRTMVSCGCTRASLSSMVISPKSADTLTFQIATHQWPGPGAVTIALIGKRGSKPWHYTMQVSYHVRRMVRVAFGGHKQLTTEGFADLGTLLPSARRLPPVNLVRGTYPAEWEELRCKVPGGILTAGIKRLSTSHWRISLMRKRPYYYGSQSCMLRFFFIHKGKTLSYRLYDPVTFRIEGPVDLTPSSIFFGLADAGKELHKRIKIWVGAPKKGQIFRISSVITSGTAHYLRTRVSHNGQSVLLSLQAKELTGRVTGHIIIIVSSPGKKYRFREDYLAYVSGQKEMK